MTTAYKKGLREALIPLIQKHYKSVGSDSELTEKILKEKNFKYDGGKDSLRKAINRTRKWVGIKYDNPYITITKSKKVLLKTDKKEGKVEWREWVGHLDDRQQLHKKASWGQDKSRSKFITDYPYIIIQPISDLHIGAIGTDYNELVFLSDTLLKYDNLYAVILGDVADNFVNFRNMLAVHQQIISPEQQDELIESWIKEIKHKILFATWGNHEEFEEKASGRNIIKRILKHNVVYFNGMAQAKIKVNDIEYGFAVTHKTRYYTAYNKTHGIKRMLREEFPECDIGIAGDKHVPGYEEFVEAGRWKLALQLGTLKVDDGYSKRYFSYKTLSDMPCVVLNTKVKEFIPFRTIERAIDFTERQ